MGKERLLWADSLKGWLMLIVVLGHVLQQLAGGVDGGSHLWAIIYSFHMPAFIAVSGWFVYRCNRNRGGYLTACKRRCYQLLLPYLIWSIIKIVYNHDYTSSAFCDIILSPDYSFWFLWILFWINVAFIGAQYIADMIKKDELIIISIIAFILVVLMAVANIRVFGFQFLAYYFVFYVMGYCMHRFENLCATNKIVITLLGVIWLYLAWYWQMSHVPANIANIPHLPASWSIQGYRFITAIIAVILILSLAPKCLNGRNKINSAAVEIGTISLGIYTTHWLIIKDVIHCLELVLGNIPNWRLIVVASIVLTIVSYIIVKLLNKFKFTSQLLLGKYN